jgi:hypothetical protein
VENTQPRSKAKELIPLALASFRISRPYPSTYSLALGGAFGGLERRGSRWFVPAAGVEDYLRSLPQEDPIQTA